MKYKLTFLNGLAFLYLFGCFLDIALNYKELSYGEGWGMVGMTGLIGIGIAALVLDLVIQVIFRSKRK